MLTSLLTAVLSGLLATAASAAPRDGEPAGPQLAGPGHGDTGRSHQVHTVPRPPSNAHPTTHDSYGSTRNGLPAGGAPPGPDAAPDEPCTGCTGTAGDQHPRLQLPGNPSPRPAPCPSGTLRVDSRCDGAPDDGVPLPVQPRPAPPAAPNGLAFTGIPVLLLLAVAGAAAGSGIALVAVGRTRPRR